MKKSELGWVRDGIDRGKDADYNNSGEWTGTLKRRRDERDLRWRTDSFGAVGLTGRRRGQGTGLSLVGEGPANAEGAIQISDRTRNR